MSQNDFVIANANGSTVRADINSALQALASLSSGSSAPGTTYANQFWHDDTNDILKIRDEANANWINAFSKVGTTWVPYSNGSVLGTLANLNYASINQNLALNAKSLAFASTAVSSGTPDFATSGNVVTLSGTATANTLGTVQAGFIGVIHYGVAITITHNGTSRILPTAANILTAVGDVEIALSLGSGNWRTIAYMRASGAALVGSAASQAEMEAGSSTLVFSTPARQHFHKAHPKAWCIFDASSGTPTLGDDYGIATIGDDGVGRHQANLDTAFATTNYTVVGSARTVTAATCMVAQPDPLANDPKTTSAYDFRSRRADTATAQDSGEIALEFFGDL